MPRPHPRRLALALLCLAAATPAVAQNVVKNGRFHTDAAGWPGGSRNPSDASGWPGSGSLEINNKLDNANYGFVTAQCVPVAPGALTIRVKAFLPAGQSRTGHATLFANAFSTANCTGTAVGSKSIGTNAAPGAWATLQGDFTPPAGAAAVKVYFGVVKNEAGGELRGRFDDVFVGTACKLSTTNLCLGGHRFGVEARWTTPGSTGQGVPIPLSGDTGYYWFFNPANVEAVTKTINGCNVNGHFWFFAGGLTNVRVDLKVTDFETNTVKTYTNPQGKPFQPIQDTGAFATCP